MALKKLSMAQRTEASAHPVVNAVDDEALREEVALIVAATGRSCVEENVSSVASEREGAGVSSALWRRAPAVFVDVPAARRLAGRPHCEGALFLVRSDLESEDTQVTKTLAPVYSASLPADNVDIVELLGRSDVGASAGLSAADDGNHSSVPVSVADSPVASRSPLLTPLPTSPDTTAVCLMLVPAVGGAGASIAAAASALVASRETSVCLVDADVMSGGIDLVLGMETEPGLRWQDFSASDGRLDGAALYEALPACPQSPALKVLTWSRSRTRGVTVEQGGADSSSDINHIASTISCLIHAGITVIVDCPRQVEYVTTVGALADDIVIVVPTSVRGIAAAGHLASICRSAGFTPRLAVRHQQHRDISVDEVEDAFNVPIVGEIEFCKKVAHEIDVGGLTVSVGKLTRGLDAMFALVSGDGDG